MINQAKQVDRKIKTKKIGKKAEKSEMVKN